MLVEACFQRKLKGEALRAVRVESKSIAGVRDKSWQTSLVRRRLHRGPRAAELREVANSLQSILNEQGVWTFSSSMRSFAGCILYPELNFTTAFINATGSGSSST